MKKSILVVLFFMVISVVSVCESSPVYKQIGDCNFSFEKQGSQVFGSMAGISGLYAHSIQLGDNVQILVHKEGEYDGSISLSGTKVVAAHFVDINHQSIDIPSEIPVSDFYVAVK